MPKYQSPSAVPRRFLLPPERQSITHTFTIGSVTGTITVGLYDDGTPGEVFISADKQGSMLNGMLQALGASLSIGLQRGIELQTYVDKFNMMRFEPMGETDDESIRQAKSFVDYLAKWLDRRFLAPQRSRRPHLVSVPLKVAAAR